MRIVRALTRPLVIWALATTLLASLRSFGAQVTLSWAASTDPNIAGYKLYYSSVAGSSSLNVGNVTSATIPGLSDGTTYAIYATVYDTAGLESGPSSHITYMTPAASNVTPPPPDPTPDPTPSPTTSAPTLTAQPVSQTLGVGNPLQLSVTATGSQPMTYAWYRNFALIPSAGGSTFQVAAATTADGGFYYATVSNSLGSVTTRAAMITITQLDGVPPSIAAGPVSQTLSAGGLLSLSVQASGSSPLQYQWFRDGSPIANAIGASLQIAAVQTTDAGSYTVRISNSVGSVTSVPAVITVNVPVNSVVAPTITVQPTSKTLAIGSALNLAVTASGTAPLNYQWLKNGVAIGGATSATLQISNAQATDSGSYTVRVSNSAGTALSAAAQVSIGVAPAITQQPAGQSVLSGARVELNIQASGTSPLFYQWYRDGAAVPGGTAATLVLSSAAVGDSGSYTATVSNSAGSATSFPAQLTVSPAPVIDPPLITAPPSSQTVAPGTKVIFSVEASGSAPLFYQWFLNGNAISGATSSTLTISVAQSINAGSYTVNVSNSAGTAKSSTAILTITGPPNITQQPQNQTVSVGSALDVTVQAAGTPPLQYQWFRNGVALSLATGSTYHLTSVRTTDAGSYTVNVSNGSGSVSSAAAVITVIAPPAITTQPAAQTVNVGSMLNLAVSASGAGSLSYQWFRNGVAIPDATSSNFQVTSAAQTDAGQYFVRVSNTAGSVNSLTVNVTVNLLLVAPAITIPPTAQTVTLGSPLTLAVEVTGSTPMQFQWYRSGVALPNGTSALLQIASAQATDGGNYTVTISNAGGSISSTPVLVTILNPPVITLQPQSKSVVAGSSASLGVTASGSAPFTYQWLKNGIMLPGQTAAGMNIALVQVSDAGDYSVKISNGAGNVTSSTATLTVTPAPTGPVISVQPLGQVIASGSPVNLSVLATGTAPLLFQWYRNGLAIPNAQSATFQIATAQTADTASYSVSVSNAAGSVVSSGAIITVLEAPTIAVQPQSKSVATGSSLSLTVTASGSGPLSYQWSKNGSLLPGAVSTILDLGVAESAEAGNYQVTISNGVGSTNSAIATVTVTAAPVSPRISVQPANQTAASGEPLRLSVVASGSTPLQYQWFRNGVAIQSANADTFQIDAPKTTDSALYNVKISNMAGSLTSDTALVTVLDAPAITQQPQSKSVTVGSTLNLAASVSGSAPLTYQWFKNDLLLPGATSAILDLGAAEFTEAGRYYLAISNPVGETNTTSATIQVTAAPVPAGISVQPLDQTVAAGPPLTLSVVATGSTPLQYQWFRNGIAIQNATRDTFQIDAPKTTDSALYTVKVSNSVLSVTSAPALITVLDPVLITEQPQSRSVTIGSALNFGVSAFGSAPLSYQWFKDGTPLPAATSATLDLGTAASGEAGNYYVTISNPVGTTNSTVATVQVTAAPVPAGISIQPLDQTVASGRPLTLSVVATGSTPLQYQWFRNGIAIQNATGDKFRIDAPKTTDSALYTVKVSNSVLSVTSTSAAITVLDAPAISEQPQSKSVTLGSALTLSVTVSGSAPLSFQWFKDGAALAAATSATLDLGTAASGEAGDYYVRISNPVGNTNSATATVSVTAAAILPRISVQPVDQTVPSGQPLLISVVATGSTPLQYQWFRNGVAIENANTDTFRMDAPGTTDSALYSVKVSNPAGSVSSAAAVITFLDPLVITEQPESKSVGINAALNLAVAASGSAPVSYQWFKNGLSLPGATSATLDLGAAQSTEAGEYYVKISNPVSTTNSMVATVAVTGPLVAPDISVQPLDQTIPSGTALTLSVSATGSAPLQYQWFRNGSSVRGANANLFQLGSAQTNDSGSYSVTISNSVGSITSRLALISVFDPPSITAQPESKSALTGSPLTLTVGASGSEPLRYQWLRNGIPISGATSATLNLGLVQSSASGDYSVEVSNTVGQISSSFATVTVTTAPVAPRITLQPVGQTVAPGGAATLSVQATGTNPLQYQWYRNGLPIANAINPVFQIFGAQQTDAATYTVKITNAAGSTTSASAVLTVDGSLAAPVITTQPLGQNLSDGSVLSLSVQATGANLAYQWFHDGILVPAQTTGNYRVSSVQTSDAGTYNVRVSNASGSVTSEVVNVTVTARPTAPTIVQAPIGQTVTAGSPFTLSVQASGSAPLQFQWFRNGRALQNGTTATLQIPAAQAIDAGDYAVNIANAGGSVSTDPVTVTVILPPVIAQQPVSTAVSTGDSLALTVVATSQSAMTYQWYRDGVAVPNATSTTLQINAVQRSNAGGYVVRISNVSGTVTSTAATVTVSDPTVIPSILTQPASQTLAVGSPLTLFVQASGTGPLQYQWYRNAVAIQNANSAAFQKPVAGTADAASYTVKISNNAGSVTSLAAVITVLDPPLIAKPPTSQTVAQGSPITLTVQASGAPTLTYRWSRNGIPLPGANSASYQIASASMTDSGTYTVQVANGDGSVTSSPATITVTGVSGPVIVTQPASQSVLAGSDCTFIVQASGSGLQYQWFLDGMAIPNATNALLRLLDVDKTDAGEYEVTVSNSTGSVVSVIAALVVNSPPVITSQPVSQTVNASGTLTLRASASGSDPLRYQWLRDGFAVSGGTNAVLQIAQVKASDAGNYVLRVSNDLGSVNSQSAVVIVLLPPSMVTQPASQTLTIGKPVTFIAQAMGVGPLQYQWFLNGAPIPNATGSAFQIAAAQSSDAGIYTLQVSNAAGFVTSDPAILGTSIANQFAISKQPLSQVLAVGSVLNLSVQITGGLALQYQWFRNGIAIGGATTPNLKIGSLQTSDAGAYALRITSSAGILMSDPATIRVVIAPGIIVQPASQNVTVGSSVTLLVQATGSAPLQYQWSRELIPIPNATDATFKIPSAQSSDAGSYSVRISNEAGGITSANAVVTILVPPSITTAPASRSLAPGSALDLSVQATGSGPLLYQWFRNGLVIPNATSRNLHFDAVSSSDAAAYAVSVANPAGMVTSDPAIVTVVAAPVITSPPERQVLPIGAPLLLTVGFTGSNPQFQWFRDAFPLPGATNSILEIPSVDFADGGAYRVTISNVAGAVSSSPALVVILAPPSIAIQPLGVKLSQGSTAILSILADGSDPLSYQWFRDGQAVPGATAAAYSFIASTNNAGNYHVEVTNPLGTVSSIDALVTVITSATTTEEPRMDIAFSASSDLVLQTIGEPGQTYDFQSSDEMPPKQWETIGSATAGADGIVQFTATRPTVDAKFYRVINRTQ